MNCQLPDELVSHALFTCVPVMLAIHCMRTKCPRRIVCVIPCSYGRRYGLLGLNGCGKSSMLKALVNREVRAAGRQCNVQKHTCSLAASNLLCYIDVSIMQAKSPSHIAPAAASFPQVPIPAHIDMYYLDKEIEASDVSAVEVGYCASAAAAAAATTAASGARAAAAVGSS